MSVSYKSVFSFSGKPAVVKGQCFPQRSTKSITPCCSWPCRPPRLRPPPVCPEPLPAPPSPTTTTTNPTPTCPFLDLHASPAAVVAGIHRPPLPKGSLEFQTLMDDFWPREAESACTTTRQGSKKAKAESRSATPQRLLGPGPGGAGLWASRVHGTPSGQGAPGHGLSCAVQEENSEVRGKETFWTQRLLHHHPKLITEVKSSLWHSHTYLHKRLSV